MVLGPLSKECEFTYELGLEKSCANRTAVDPAGWAPLLSMLAQLSSPYFIDTVVGVCTVL